MLALVLTPAAEAEVADAQDWYEKQAPGLGAALIAEIDRVAARITSTPEQFPLVHRDVRRAFLRRFPYAIFFRVAENEIQVLACFHTSRDPKRWRERQ